MMKGEGLVKGKVRFEVWLLNEGRKNLCMMIKLGFERKMRILIFENIVWMGVDS